MMIRNPAVAGTFYPASSAELASKIKGFLEGKPKGKAVGLVSPHAGYAYCGRQMAAAHAAAAKSDFETAVILGPNHMGLGPDIASSEGLWKTPLGSASIDDDFVKELGVPVDAAAHSAEHSIEVQLPWLQALSASRSSRFFRFVPIAIKRSAYTKDNCKALGENIAEAAAKLKRKIIVIASSDFTHYGKAYGYAPFTGTQGQVLKKIKEMDMEVAGYAAKLMPERLMEVCSERTVCGYGPIAAMLWAAKRLGGTEGELLDYSTSFETSRDSRAIVGYCAVALR
ncbi:MAG: AmmeMemoRadiSam system protein B [Candidatus Aenigmatarchaeota archaeon]